MVGPGIFQVHGYLLGGVSRIIDFQAINGNVPSKFIEQMCIIARISFTPSWMSDETHRPAPMCRVYHCSNIVGGPLETCIRDQSSCRGFSGSVAQLL